MFGEAPDADALATLNGRADVAASALLTGGRVEADGQDIGAVSIDQLKGSIEPTILTGRTVLHDGEVVLGPAFMKSHDLSVGDRLAVDSSGTAGTLTIVGSGVPLSVGSYSSDVGAIMTPADYAALREGEHHRERGRARAGRSPRAGRRHRGRPERDDTDHRWIRAGHR